MRARTAVLELLKESAEWRQFFQACCETSPLRLRSQAWQGRDELADRGQAFALTDHEDVLMDLARKFFPESPAAEWDSEWTDQLTGDAMARMQEHYAGLSAADKEALDLSEQDAYEERMNAAGENNDPAEFRRALKGWLVAGMAALHEARSGNEGAA
jgi:hypothetical protein